MQGGQRRDHRSSTPERVPRKHPLTRIAPTLLRTIKCSLCSFGFPRVRVESHLQCHRRSIFSVSLEHSSLQSVVGIGAKSIPFQRDKLNRKRWDVRDSYAGKGLAETLTDDGRQSAGFSAPCLNTLLRTVEDWVCTTAMWPSRTPRTVKGIPVLSPANCLSPPSLANTLAELPGVRREYLNGSHGKRWASEGYRSLYGSLHAMSETWVIALKRGLVTGGESRTA